MPTMAIAMIIATVANARYISNGGITMSCVLSAVGAGFSRTFIAVSAYDGQYALLPAKFAIIVYLPEISGVQIKAYVPLASVVVLPTS